MEQRQLVACTYKNLRRELCPVVLGWSDGREKLLAYQTGGASSRPLTTADTRWRCLFVDEIAHAAVREGWPRIDVPHQSTQSCVRDVDLDINPASPLRPQRRLGWQG